MGAPFIQASMKLYQPLQLKRRRIKKRVEIAKSSMIIQARNLDLNQDLNG